MLVSMRCSDSGLGRVVPLRTLLIRTIAAVLTAACCSLAFAHKASDAYLDLRPDGSAVAMRWDIALRDLDQVLDLDRNHDGQLDWGEVEQQQGAIRDYAFKSIDIASEAGPCRPAAVSQHLARRSDGAYAVLRWRADCGSPPSRVDVGYRFLLGIDPTHRAIVSVPGAAMSLKTLRPSAESQPVELRPAGEGEVSYDMAGFFVEGLRHILNGIDHLAFLTALLLPALATAAISERRLGSALGELVAVVSVFTLAHSITLGLTALDLIHLPSALVESAIALSVLVAGLQALWVWRRVGKLRPGPAAVSTATGIAVLPVWLVFAFGLIHGIGFGSALGDAGFGGRPVLSALFGFNVGVEAGQLLALAAIFPLAWTVRGTTVFRRIALPAAALAISIAGAGWFVMRAFDLDLLGMLQTG